MNSRRWKIESMFQIMKQRAFNLEQMTFTDQKKLDYLFRILTLAFALCLKTGNELHRDTPIKIRKHQRLSYSKAWLLIHS